MSQIACPVCNALVSLPKRRRPLTGPAPGRAYESRLCPSCDTDLGEQIAEHRKRRRLGVFAKAMIISVVMAFLCIAGGLTVLSLKPPPPWADEAERAFRIGVQLSLLMVVLMKGAVLLFEPRD